ncbi:hypothetical protein NW768_006767 [Fusarium equiseti]|uniref:Transcription factor n=1 Tax=Fusarium equiseti TaxID=61235 RepID=A0ABQ8R947_FUSEQ|nr:hypothetical protein NW768_006767 [Fusarium equiseti]
MDSNSSSANMNSSKNSPTNMGSNNYSANMNSSNNSSANMGSNNYSANMNSTWSPSANTGFTNSSSASMNSTSTNSPFENMGSTSSSADMSSPNFGTFTQQADDGSNHKSDEPDLTDYTTLDSDMSFTDLLSDATDFMAGAVNWGNAGEAPGLIGDALDSGNAPETVEPVKRVKNLSSIQPPPQPPHQQQIPQGPIFNPPSSSTQPSN